MSAPPAAPTPIWKRWARVFTLWTHALIHQRSTPTGEHPPPPDDGDQAPLRPPPPRWVTAIRLALIIILPFVILYGILITVSIASDRQYQKDQLWLTQHHAITQQTTRETRLDGIIQHLWPSWKASPYIYRITIHNLDGQGLRKINRRYNDIEYLQLTTPTLTAADLATLNHFPYLDTLVIDGGAIPTTDLLKQPIIAQLRQFELTSHPLTPDDVATIASNKHLSTLRLDDCGIGPNHLQHLTTIRVSTLSLNDNPITDRGIHVLIPAHLRQIPDDPDSASHAPTFLIVDQNLELARCQLTDTSIERLTYLPKTPYYLNLAGNPITDQSIHHLAHLNLHSIQLSNTHITGRNLALLTTTKDLSLNGIDLHPDAYHQLAQLPLTTLLLNHTKTTDKDLRHLLTPNHDQLLLEEINLDYTPITNQAIPLLRDIPSLMNVTLAHTAIDDQAFTKQAKRWPLHALDLSGTSITGITLSNINTINLYLADCTLSESGIQDLIHSSSRILNIDLSGTIFADHHLAAWPKEDLPAILDLRETAVTATGLNQLPLVNPIQQHLGRTVFLSPTQIHTRDIKYLLPNMVLFIENRPTPKTTNTPAPPSQIPTKPTISRK